jgi:hypothetical protein
VNVDTTNGTTVNRWNLLNVSNGVAPFPIAVKLLLVLAVVIILALATLAVANIADSNISLATSIPESSPAIIEEEDKGTIKPKLSSIVICPAFSYAPVAGVTLGARSEYL